MLTQAISSEAIQLGHLVARVRQDHPRFARMVLSCAIPAINQIGACQLARLGGVNVSGLLIDPDRFSRSACRQLPGRVALPVLTLTPHLHDLDTAVTFGDRAEGGARFDRLELFGIADEHQLGAALLGFAHDAFELARADHARPRRRRDMSWAESSSLPCPH